MDDRSWLERTFGKSPETTLPALIGGPAGLLLVVIGLWLDSKEALGLGITIAGGAFTFGLTKARSDAQHLRDEQNQRPPPPPAGPITGG